MNVIEIKNVVKRFRAYADKAYTLKEKALFRKRRKFKEREVLKGISLTIRRGEVVGLIGENGCGKSTLLKLMTKIMYPDEGTVTVSGRVSSMIELGAGFHPDMSGRENVYTNAAIYGLSKKETDERFQDILDFSELHEYIDSPVRTYSSGMYMRLAFSVAINVDADILLIDEILAVGDRNFQAKCFAKLDKLKESGTTIVIVTHDVEMVEEFCTRAVWISDGRIAKQGNRISVTEAYKKYMSDKQASLFDNGKDFDKTDVYLVYYYLLGRRPEDEKTLNHALNGYLNREEMVRQVLLSDEFAGKRNSQEFDGKDDDQIYRAFESYRYTKRFEEGDVLQRNVDSALLDDKDAKANKTIRFGDERTTITGACFSNDLNKKIGYLTSGIDAVLLISFEINELAKQYNFGFDIYTMDDVQCFGTDMMLDGFQYTETEEQGQPKRERHVRCLLENMNLAPGEYKFNVYVMDENNIPMDYIENYGTFFVKSDEDTRDAGDARGVIDLKKKWFTEKILEEIRKRRGVSNDD